LTANAGDVILKSKLRQTVPRAAYSIPLYLIKSTRSAKTINVIRSKIMPTTAEKITTLSQNIHFIAFLSEFLSGIRFFTLG
jgi:hypothetical protein